ncbi:MAG: hypothetical protein IKC22_02280 [Bacilli bacterium]|nr:hypothetical protein [Bacilli bacterium]
MSVNQEKELRVFNEVPFVPASQLKIADNIKDEINDQELFLILSTLVQEGKIQMTMGPKGPEYSRKWNQAIDEERKQLSRVLNKRFEESVIFYPRYEGYVANVFDNFIDDEYSVLFDAYKELSPEYVLWHKNAKTGVVYPPKMHSLNSANVLVYNMLKAQNAQVSKYAVELDVLQAEALKDKPEEIVTPKVLFDAVVESDSTVEFVQGNFLEHYLSPFRQSLWAYQFGNRFLFEDDHTINAIREIAKHTNFVCVDGVNLIKEITAVCTEIFNNTESYKGKKVVIKNLTFCVKTDSEYQALAEYQAQYNAEAERLEKAVNEELQYLPLPEGITLEVKYARVCEEAEKLEGSKKEYIVNRYLGY